MKNGDDDNKFGDHTPTIKRLTKDLKLAAMRLGDKEARFLVDQYYLIQDYRIASSAQARTLSEIEEPVILLSWLGEQFSMLEGQITRALDVYTNKREVGKWARNIIGIGPIITAGLLANIDIKQAPTVGHIWSFAGLVPGIEWNKGEKRPWNARLKTLCAYKIGESFVRVSGNEKSLYGRLYKERKAAEIKRNEAGLYTQRAEEKLAKYKIGKTTEAYKAYSIGKLPPAHIHARARRWVVKLFLSHLHAAWYHLELKTEPPRPYILTPAGGHAHEISWKDAS